MTSTSDDENKTQTASESRNIKKAAKTIGIIGAGAVGAIGLATVALPVIGFTAGIFLSFPFTVCY